MQELNYAMLRRKIYRLKEKYPFAGYSVCARSWSGRALFKLSIGECESPALYVAGIKGGDKSSVSVMLTLFETLCESIKTHSRVAGIRIGDVLNEKSVIILPCVNPDGMEIVSNGAVGAGSYAGLVERVCTNTSSWRANARGVDLNLNFAKDFSLVKKVAEGCGYTSPGPYFYAGKVPESEPETRALVKLCKSCDIRHTLMLQGGADCIYSPALVGEERHSMMLKILELSSGLSRLDGEPSPLEKHGFADWFSSVYKKPSFVINAQNSDVELYNKLEEMLVLSIVM